MRRYTFYLAVALLAFGVGSLVVFKFYFKHAEHPVTAQTTEKYEPQNMEQIPVSKLESSHETETNYEEWAAFEVLKPTIGKWLRGERIKSERQEISDEFIKLAIGRNEIRETERIFWQETGLEFTPYLIDVNGDGVNELAVRNYCAPVGNCQFWLFKKTGKKGNLGYEILLKASNDVQMFKLRKSITNGYFDLETKSHGDAWSGGMDIYKFDKTEYKLSECYDYNYSYLNDGELYELKKAKVTPRKCGE